MKIAACWSITAARFFRLTSAAISSRSTAAVDSRSSHSAIGKSVSFARLRAKARDGLRARSFAAVHVERKAEHETNAATFRCESQHAFGIHGECLAGNRFHAGGEPPLGVRGGDADGLGTDIEAEQCTAQRQVMGDLAHFDDDGRHETTFPCLDDAPQVLTLA